MNDDEQLLSTLAQLGATVAPGTLSATHDPGTTVMPPSPTRLDGPERALAALKEAGRPGALELGPTLGQGGMGVVHQGTQRTLGREVAVKLLSLASRTEGATLRLLHEAWITGSLEHPNIVPIYDLGLDPDGSPVIVLKLIEGESWRNLLADGERVRREYGARDLLSWHLQILMQVCNAVHFAHSKGIVHRDLKPDNVMIGRFGEVYLLDWGIAVAMEDDGSGRFPLARDAHELAGTLAYMAPEMLGGEPSRISPRTDVYLLGAILYELLDGEPPHRGASLYEVARSISEGHPVPKGGQAPELAEVCARALEPDPDRRFESAEALRQAIVAFLDHRGSTLLALEAERILEQLTEQLRVELGRPAAGDEGGAPAGEGGARAGEGAERADEGAARARLYHLFGECRFGFQQALRDWPENPSARAGLSRAARSMAEYELQRGDPQSAALLLADQDDVPDALRERIAEAERRQRLRDEQVRELVLDRDVRVGSRVRDLVVALLGATWVGGPILSALLGPPGPRSHLEGVIILGLLTVAVIAVGYISRRDMTRTIYNRALLFSAGISTGFGALLAAATVPLGIGSQRASVLTLLVCAAVSATAFALVDRRMLVATLGYLAGFVIGCVRPLWFYYLMSAANLGLVLTVLAVARLGPRETASPWPPSPAE